MELKSPTLKSIESRFNNMATEKFRNEFLSYIKSRHPLIYLCTIEENRFIEYVKLLVSLRDIDAYTWDCHLGIRNLIDGNKPEWSKDKSDIQPNAALDKILDHANINGTKFKGKPNNNVTIYFLLDFHRFLDSCAPSTERRLKEFIRISKKNIIVLVGPSYYSTESLNNDLAVLDFPFPSKQELNNILDKISKSDSVKNNFNNITKIINDKREDLIKAASGLTLAEAQDAYAKSVVMAKQIGYEPFDIEVVLEEKKQIIRKTGILEYYDSPFKASDVGGLDPLLLWLKHRKLAFSDNASNYGLPAPKGVMFAGIPGTGKSLCAKVISNIYKMPLIRLDFGRLFNSLVGESERTVRQAINIVESVAPCVLWADEIEKAISGISSSGNNDSGVTSRVLSTFLTWMQEKTSPVFVVFTANDVERIPPEFMRAGRLDEIFFVDLPGYTARKQIFSVILNRMKRDSSKFDLDLLSTNSEDYSGAEIEKSIQNALFVGFAEEEREITDKDIIIALGQFNPLSKIRAKEFDYMRKIMKGNSVSANTEDSKEDIKISKSKKISKNKNIEIDIV